MAARTALTPEIRALLTSRALAHLATVLPDGSPHTVPVWVGLDGDRVLFLTGPTSRKARNIAADPRVALSLVDPANPAAMGQIRGRVVEVRDDEHAWQLIDEISRSYIGAPYPLRTDRALYTVAPEHVFTWAPG
ncbi:MAG TPA: PPOX class F420-dependent oxidoreductase [Pseudonocardiaceae bacterium]|jgi:PPOX class probable F420-dependent enzyme|nr:PPOX class F420-dependent oxidoreductase [Pseudonocardiaceae bacterium]